ncbi:MAG: TolB family protein [Acidimicrobiales bacterium]
MELRRLLESRSARALDEDSDGRLLVGCDLGGTFQLYELSDHLRQLTDFVEPVTGKLVPGTRQAIAQMDSKGNERYQLYLMDLDDPPMSRADRLQALTRAPESVHHLLGVRADGRQVAFCSNQRNGLDFDVYTVDLETREIVSIYEDGGWVQPATGYSPSGRYLSFLVPGTRPLDVELCVADLPGGEMLHPMPHPGEAATVGGPAWVGEDSFIVSSNVGHDVAGLVWHDLVSGTSSELLRQEHDLACVSSADRRVHCRCRGERRGPVACRAFRGQMGGTRATTLFARAGSPTREGSHRGLSTHPATPGRRSRAPPDIHIHIGDRAW